jgi:hypothetical protein
MKSQSRSPPPPAGGVPFGNRIERLLTLDGIELGRVGRQEDGCEVARHDQFVGAVPSAAGDGRSISKAEMARRPSRAGSVQPEQQWRLRLRRRPGQEARQG